MEQLNLKSFVEPRLNKVWEDFYKDPTSYPPLYPRDVKANIVLFLSLNPSMSPNSKDAKKGYICEDFYPNLDCSKTYVENKTVPHFKKFFEIGEEINENWTFLDLLYLRDSSQSAVMSMYKSEKGKIFIGEQVKLTLEIIKEIKPKLVIVANRFVDTLLHNSEIAGFKSISALDGENIYRWKGTPFIIKETGFLGDRRWKMDRYRSARENMYSEIDSVLKIIDDSSGGF